MDPQRKEMNSARRLLGLLERANSMNSSMSMANVFFNAAFMDGTGVNEDKMLTMGMEVIMKARALLDEVEQSVKAKSKSQKYADCFARIRVYMHPSYAPAAWENSRKQIYAEGTLTVLELMGDMLPADSEELTNKEIAALLAKLYELQREFDKSELPPFHKHYAKLMLGVLRRALIDYTFFGVESFRAAARETVGIVTEMEGNAATLSEEASTCTEAGSKLLGSIKELANSTVELAKNIYYVGGAVAIAAKGAEKLQLLIK